MKIDPTNLVILFIIVVTVLALMTGGGKASTSSAAPAPAASANTQPCYDAANAAVKEFWANINEAQRSVVFFQIANECEAK